MTPLLVLGLLVGVALANPAPTYGNNNNAFPAQFAPNELQNLEGYIAGVRGERDDLRQRLDALKDDQDDLLIKLNVIVNKLNVIDGNQGPQDNRIRAIVNRIRNLLIAGGDLEGRIVGQVEVTNLIVGLVDNLRDRVDGLEDTNAEQNSLLDQARTFINDAAERLNQQITARVDEAEGGVSAIVDDTESLANFIDTRRCYRDFVGVDLTPDGDGQAIANFPANYFAGNDVPVVFCGIQGFISDINLDQSSAAPAYPPQNVYGHGPSYGVPDERQNLAVAVNCQAFDDRVEVSAVDQSRGQGNDVLRVYVEVRACTFSARFGNEVH